MKGRRRDRRTAQMTGARRVKVELSDVMCAGIFGGQDFLEDTRAAVCQSQTLHWATGPQGHWTTEN